MKEMVYDMQKDNLGIQQSKKCGRQQAFILMCVMPKAKIREKHGRDIMKEKTRVNHEWSNTLDIRSD